MKRVIILLLLVSTLLYGCVSSVPTPEGNLTNNITTNLTKSEAEQLALKKVYDLTKNKEIYKEKGPWVRKSWREQNRWVVIVWASHTIIETHVYDNKVVKVLPTTYSIQDDSGNG